MRRTGAATGEGGRVGAGRSGEVSLAWRRGLPGLSGPSGQGQQNCSQWIWVVLDFPNISNIAEYDIIKHVGAVLNTAIPSQSLIKLAVIGLVASCYSILQA